MEHTLYLSIFFIILITIIILKKIYSYQKIRITVLERSQKSQIENNTKLRNKIKELEFNHNMLDLSVTNLKNALSFKPLQDGKRHIDVYTLDEGQEIVVIFDEIYRYKMEYFEQNPLCKKEPYIKSINLRCMTFIDGTTHDPILLDTIGINNKFAIIDPIDCGKHKGRGLGTCVIQSLSRILKQMNVKELRASLSINDYHKKDKLYNFYIDNNGFELINELTEDSWGLVIKYIK